MQFVSARSTELNPEQTLHVPTTNTLVLPSLNPDATSAPLQPARVLAHLFLIDGDKPVFLHEVDLHWPRDKGKEFAVKYKKAEITFRLVAMEARKEDPSSPYVEVERGPYLYVEGAGQLHLSGLFGGGSAMFGSQLFDETLYSIGGYIDGKTVVAVLMPCATADPVRNISLRELVKARWAQLGPQVDRLQRPSKSGDEKSQALAAWSEIAGVQLPDSHAFERYQGVYARRLEQAGGAPGSGAVFRKIGLIDLDTSRTLEVDTPPDIWPEGFDLLWDEARHRWTVRPNSLVRTVSLPVTRNEFEALRAARDRAENLDTQPPSTSKGDLLVRTDQGNLVIILNRSSGSSGPPFGKKTTFTGFRWFFLLEPANVTPVPGKALAP